MVTGWQSAEALVLVAALLLAWAWDVCFGEPPKAWHPVTWLGKLLWPLGCRLRLMSPKPAFWWSAAAWALMAFCLGWMAWEVQALLLDQPVWLAAPLLALLLKPTFAWRMLRDEVMTVEAGLAEDLEQARATLSGLVSRDISELSEEGLRETAIETLAENLNDSVIAPLFWFAVAGLPGAAIYRFANAVDAMWGYRGIWEWTGKWAAQANDLLSWLPARITALALYPTWRSSAWRALRRQARRTSSPNAGWAKGAMALRLGVRLAKPGAYVLNETGAAPSPGNMGAALRYAGEAAWAGFALALLAWLARSL